MACFTSVPKMILMGWKSGAATPVMWVIGRVYWREGNGNVNNYIVTSMIEFMGDFYASVENMDDGQRSGAPRTGWIGRA